MMKISIVSITFNDGKLLKRTLDSIHAQELPPGTDIEHIIVDGGSSDESSQIITEAEKAGSIILHREPKGCYNALNEGIAATSGDIIGILHGNDLYAHNKVLANVVDTFAGHSPDFTYGDIRYIRPDNSLGRIYSARGFKAYEITKGFAPPHPSLFMTRGTMQKIGPYKEDYRVAADFELFVRLFLGKTTFSSRYIPGPAVLMQTGGLSSKLYSRLVTNTLEKRRALLENGFNTSFGRLMLRYLQYKR